MLEATDKLDMIDAAVVELAADRIIGRPVLLQSLSLATGEELFQHKVGRYKLNYTLTRRELNVVSVMI